MNSIPRGIFCPTPTYEDRPCFLLEGATLSAPSIHAWALDLFADRLPSSRSKLYALDVGSGSGYMSVALSRLLGRRKHRVIGIEYQAALVPWSQRRVAFLKEKHVEIRHGDGWKGDPAHQYAFIYVGAAPETVPNALLEQLAPGGRMIIPVGSPVEGQRLMVIDKSADGASFETRDIGGVRFVPLVQQ